ncbi:hypothetical protein [Brunnivagina elsteri]|uniref:Uncharacterized protein n=1 Tax=Brunnivagina elsteri CCALA 953 TaxID=987040 RepID=A0A2A2TE39_9CYAN|nr:hypothetical protein [Calothrix elsteri]PAX51918.1 hypothetical protein CK510_22185 [Calothrix elsteri CCALA 953]
MVASVRQILDTFDRLTESEQQEIALEILKRVSNLNLPPLSDDELVLNAEALFLELDRQEANYE